MIRNLKDPLSFELGWDLEVETECRAGLYHMQAMRLHRAARKKGAKSGAPEKLRGAKNGGGATKFTISVTMEKDIFALQPN